MIDTRPLVRKGNGTAVHIGEVTLDGNIAGNYTLCDGTGWARVRVDRAATAPTCKACLRVASDAIFGRNA